MILHRFRIAVMATMLAFVAVLGMSVLGGWHAATFHDDARELTVATAHVHVAGAIDDRDADVVHVAAHMVGHAFAVPAHDAPSLRLADIAPAWPMLAAADRAGTGPLSLLKPPRA